MIPETAYDTIGTPIIFNFNGRVIIPWSVRRIGALGNNTVELLSDVSNQLLIGPTRRRTLRENLVHRGHGRNHSVLRRKERGSFSGVCQRPEGALSRFRR